jgi:hypothetical protein
VRIGGVINKYKVGKHFDLRIDDTSFSYSLKAEPIAAEAALDGLRVIRTSVAERDMSAQAAVLTHAAFPRYSGGSASATSLSRLLRLHSRYGPLARSTAQGGLCRKAPARPVTRTSRLPATRLIDNSLGRTYLHWCCAPSGRTQ